VTVAYFDCFAGISGNMVLGAFINLGLDIEEFKEAMSLLPIEGYIIEHQEVKKQGIAATHVDIQVTQEQPHRHLYHIEEIIMASQLPREVQELALKIFTRLAEAEAKVHNTTIERIHFHEVGAVDAIIDIVGAAWGIHKLGITKVYASPLHVGKGVVKCAHGLMPIPAPATAELLKGAPTYSGEIQGELVTPTGAAIITTLTQEFGEQPLLKVKHIGYGAGTWDLAIPNLLRISLGEEASQTEQKDKALVIEANIDDMNPEFYDYLLDKLLSQGAVDVFYTPIQMKKNRPAVLLTVICEENQEEIIQTLFLETTTLGIRAYEVDRRKQDKEFVYVSTPWGEVKVKLGKEEGRVLNIKPEYEECKVIAQKTGLPLKEVWQRVLVEYYLTNR